MIKKQFFGFQETNPLIRFYFLLLILWPLGAAQAQDGGEIISALGMVEVLRDGRWQKAAVGETLNAGETVRTGADSRAALQLSSGSQLKLNARSQVQFKQIAPPSEGFLPTASQVLRSVLKVLNGEIWVRNSGEALDIETVPATATIRGTEFNLAVHPEDSAQLAVIDGLVEFSNPHGSVLVAANEQATVKLGEAPRKSVLLNPLDAVQWSFYYPNVGGPATGDSIQAAQTLLQNGRVAEARQALDRALALHPNDARAYGLRSTIALVQNQKAQALADAERAVAADPALPSAYLSLSLVKQAEFDLDGALAAAQKAVQLDPDNAHALIQESSLLFGMGRTQDAFKLAERAKQKAPDDAHVNTVCGFIQLARYQVKAARAAFEAAIAQDSTLGLPHLGLGLVHFRHNQTEAAIAEIRKATLLEPNVSLYNSYLGKAFYEAKQDRRAEKYLAIAKQLDSRDPTPYLYDAIRLQSMNRPIAAVENLQKSIELNDDRAVYRSRLLLDEDEATRSATLGRIYNEVGFTQLGLKEGWQSVSRDPGNASAHRLLADTYATMPQREMARVSELLQAQLLQPLNSRPVSPQMAETRLLMPNPGPFTPSLYEFNPLFTRNQPSLFFSGAGGNEETLSNDLIVSGVTDRVSYSIGQSHYQTDGFRPNNDLKNDLYNLFVQMAVTPDFNLQAEYRHRESEFGDRRFNFDGSFASAARLRRSTDQDTARIGGRYALSPETQIIASVIYANRAASLRFPSVNFRTGLESEGAQMEAQLLYKTNDLNILTGLGSYSLERTNIQTKASVNAERQMAYSYANIKFLENLIWTIGLSYQDDEESARNLSQFYPKLGLQWAMNEWISLRAAAFKSVRHVDVIDQTIEPTQVAGFNQFYNNFTMTVASNYGVGLDVRFNNHLFGGLEALRRDLEVPIGNQGDMFYEIERDQENFYSAYLNWLPSEQWSLSASVLYEGFQVEEGTSRQLFFSFSPNRLRTISLPLDIRYFDPSGFFAGLGVVYVNQEVQFLDPRTITVRPTESENFTLLNAGVGYRLPKRLGVLSFEVNNLLDRKFRYQDYTFQITSEAENTRYIPERTFLGRLVFNF